MGNNSKAYSALYPCVMGITSLILWSVTFISLLVLFKYPDRISSIRKTRPYKKASKNRWQNTKKKWWKYFCASSPLLHGNVKAFDIKRQLAFQKIWSNLQPHQDYVRVPVSLYPCQHKYWKVSKNYLSYKNTVALI